jgi:hypothetical protein
MANKILHINYPNRTRIVAGFLIALYLLVGIAAYSHSHDSCSGAAHDENSSLSFTASSNDDNHLRIFACFLCDFIINLNFDINKSDISLKSQEIVSYNPFNITNELFENPSNPISPRGPPGLF